MFVGVTDWSYAALLPGLGNESLALGAKLAVACLLILPQSMLLGMTFPLMSAGLVRAQPGARRRIGGDALLHQQPGRRRRRAGERLRADRVGRAARHAADRGRAEPRSSRRSCGCSRGPSRHAAIRAESNGESNLRLLLAVAFFTGLASFIYEIGWIRMLSLVLGASTHSFELMLSTFILGLALGGLGVRRRVDASAEPVRLLGWVQVAMGARRARHAAGVRLHLRAHGDAAARASRAARPGYVAVQPFGRRDRRRW